MTAGFIARAPRLAVLVAVVLPASAGLTLAATSTLSTAPTTPSVAASELPPLVVPDVRHQAYVFAKGMLEQGGFAWRVQGGVRGYSANLVAAQTPAPGSKVIATGGSPTIVLRLQRNSGYAQEGTPEDTSPYPGVKARLFGAKPNPAKKPAKAKTVAAPAAKPKVTRTVAAAKPAKPNKIARKKPASTRKRAFVVAGAPAEPLDEITLAERAKKLSAWVTAHPKKTPAAVDHWLYQHNWILSGAKFGWSHGAEALQTLVAVDKRVQSLWGVGGDSESLARAALMDVRARSR
jgi:PASTA domain